MKTKIFAISILAASLSIANPAIAHDPSKHIGKPLEGTIMTVKEDSFGLHGKSGHITISTTPETKYELNGKPAERSALEGGLPARVFGTKLSSGAMVAKEVLVGDVGDAAAGHGTHSPKAEPAAK